MQNFSVHDWNTQRELNYSGCTSFKKVRAHLETFSADIITLQEMCNAKEMLENISNIKSYNFFIPKLNSRKENGALGYNFNVILSKYPILKVDEVVFPQWNKNKILENATRADIQLDNKILRIYNCHFEVFRAGIETRLKQLEYILSDVKDHAGPVIICGDLNATIPPLGWRRRVVCLVHQEPRAEMFIKGKLIDYDERELFNETINQHGFRESLGLTTSTWSPFKTKFWEVFKLKLDWFVVKNVEVTKVHFDNYVSDHRSIKVDCCV